jgi:hypothetical protein
VWPDNERALAVFQRVGTCWIYPAMGGTPIGMRWEAIYPLMDRQQLPPAEWDDLRDELAVMEATALATMREFAPKPKK